MKIIVPDGRSNFDLTPNTISVKFVNTTKIIVVDQDHEAVGILTKAPSGNWFVTDILNAQNIWPMFRPTPIEMLNLFYDPHNKILQFDNKVEFVAWLSDRIKKSISWAEA